MADQNPPSGIPLEITSAEQTVQESLPRVKKTAPASRRVEQVEEPQMETTQIAIVESSGDDDELDEIIDRVLEVVRARREGRPVPARNQKQDLGEVPVAANPAGGMNKTLIYAGVGVGVVALAGGLWWYFKKND
jgi:hypothetical protein